MDAPNLTREIGTLFKAPMVLAILAGRKTQTRRVLRPQPPEDIGLWLAENPLPIVVGDVLWVRETYSGEHFWTGTPLREWVPGPVHYWADGNPEDGDWTKPKPGIHMPRWASRLALRVTDVRVERLQDISEADAIAEGIEKDHAAGIPGVWGWHDYMRGDALAKTHFSDPRESYSTLWRSINGPGAWEANPWVAAYTFERIAT